MLLMKFGEKEHLEQLKNGIIHFSPLSTFVEDSSCFRGDPLEGKLLIDLSHPVLINGLDITPYIEQATQSFVGFESILSFSASMLNHANCHAYKNGLYSPNDDYIAEMEQFGSHVLIFSANDFIIALNKTLKSHTCNFEYHPIFYCNKTDHTAISKYMKGRQIEKNPYDYCFIKDHTPYSKQNEWRTIIHDIDGEFPIDSTGGFNLKTEFCTKMPIFETLELKSLQVSDEFLR